jgi:hypothetical protein
MHQQLWEHKVEEKLYVGVHEQRRLNTTGVGHKPESQAQDGQLFSVFLPYSSLNGVVQESVKCSRLTSSVTPDHCSWKLQ